MAHKENKEWIRKILDDRGIFPDEAKVWEELGCFIPSSRVEVVGYTSKAELYCNLIMTHIPYEVGMTIRQGLLKWTHNHIQVSPSVGGLEELEVERG